VVEEERGERKEDEGDEMRKGNEKKCNYEKEEVDREEEGRDDERLRKRRRVIRGGRGEDYREGE
jgi:hypothetical protein